MAKVIALGTPREQYLKDPNPETVRVFDTRTNKFIIINKENYNQASMTIVNELGQAIDERGIVIKGKEDPIQPSDDDSGATKTNGGVAKTK